MPETPARASDALEAPPSQLPRLTSMRALAALFVFLYHVQLFSIWAPGRYPFDIGYVGVSFFFVLSGFVLTWSSRPDGGPARFYRRRFARIYPAYATVLVLCGLASSPAAPHVTGAGAGLAAGLLQSWSMHDPGVVHAINPPSWSLSDEAFFYALLPLALPLLRRAGTRSRAVLLVGWFLATSAVVAYGSGHGAGWELIDFTFPVVRSGEFFLGVFAALQLQAGRRLRPKAAVLAVTASLLALIALPGRAPLPDVLLDPLFVAVIVLAAQADIDGRRGLVLDRPVAVYAGGLSYAFYLVHQLVLAEIGARVGHGLPIALLGLLGACGAAMALHHGIERPCQRLIMGRTAVPRLGRVPVIASGPRPLTSRARSG